jgi:hypothetical protein
MGKETNKLRGLVWLLSDRSFVRRRRRHQKKTIRLWFGGGKILLLALRTGADAIKTREEEEEEEEEEPLYCLLKTRTQEEAHLQCTQIRIAEAKVTDAKVLEMLLKREVGGSNQYDYSVLM